MTNFFQTSASVLRLLRKAPITSAAAILSLALGIGGTTTMFSAVDAVLLAAASVRKPRTSGAGVGHSPMSRGCSTTRRGGDLSPADFLDYRSASSFEGMAAVSTNSMRLTGDGTPSSCRARRSRKFFLAAGSERSRRAAVSTRRRCAGGRRRAVVSEALWERRYGRAANLIGRAITVSDQRSKSSASRRRASASKTRSRIWLLGDRGLPRFSSIGNLPQNRDVHMLTAVGRLRETRRCRKRRRSSTSSPRAWLASTQDQ
jgi:hypothetical protein